MEMREPHFPWGPLQEALQKQPLEDMIQNWCLEKFSKIHDRKTSALESLFYDVAGLQLVFLCIL